MTFDLPDGTSVPIRPQLARIILDNSESTNLGEAVCEWFVSGYRYDEDGNGICVCGQEGLKHLFTITNGINGTELYPIGSECIEKFGTETDMAFGLKALACMRYAIMNKFIEMPSRERSDGSGEGYFSRVLIRQLVRTWLGFVDWDTRSKFWGFWDYDDNMFLSWFNSADMSEYDLVRIREWYLFEGQVALCKMFDPTLDSRTVADMERRLRGQYLKRLAAEVMRDVKMRLSAKYRSMRWADVDDRVRFRVSEDISENVDRSAFPLPVAKVIETVDGACDVVEVSDWAKSHGDTSHDVLHDGVEMLVDVLRKRDGIDSLYGKGRNRYSFVWRDVLIPIFEAICAGKLRVDDMEGYRRTLRSRISANGASRVDAWETSQQRFVDYIARQRVDVR